MLLELTPEDLRTTAILAVLWSVVASSQVLQGSLVLHSFSVNWINFIFFLLKCSLRADPLLCSLRAVGTFPLRSRSAVCSMIVWRTCACQHIWHSHICSGTYCWLPSIYQCSLSKMVCCNFGTLLGCVRSCSRSGRCSGSLLHPRRPPAQSFWLIASVTTLRAGCLPWPLDLAISMPN